MDVPRQFNLAIMKELKAQELPGLRNLLGRCISRNRPIFHLEEKKDGTGIIAEIKCASPSKGEIKKVEIAEQARKYCYGGAIALSVLTDENFFGGSWSDLYCVTRNADMPVLCKEFVFFKEQIDVACALGADLVLLIARALENERMEELFEYSICRGIVPLVEVHHPEELDFVLTLRPTHILVNARNLETLQIETDRAFSTWSMIPEEITAIWASGIGSGEDIIKIKEATGARYFLIGSALMQSDDPEQFLKGLCNVC